MAMRDGIEAMLFGAVDTVRDTALFLMEKGIPAEYAVKTAAELTKASVTELLERNVANQSAAAITRTLSENREGPRLLS